MLNRMFGLNHVRFGLTRSGTGSVLSVLSVMFASFLAIFLWLAAAPPALADWSGEPEVVMVSRDEEPDFDPINPIFRYCYNENENEVNECITIRWGGYTFWIWNSFGDVILAGYDGNDELVAHIALKGDWNVYRAVADTSHSMIYLYGTLAQQDLGYYPERYEDEKDYARIRIPWGDLQELVSKYSTYAYVGVSEYDVTEKDTVNLTADVTSIGPGGPTGKVVFYNRWNALHEEPIQLNEYGEAELEGVSLPVGRHLIHVEYLGDDDRHGSISYGAEVIVRKSDIAPGDPRVEYRSEYDAPEDDPDISYDYYPVFVCMKGLWADDYWADCPMIVWGDYEFWFYDTYAYELYVAAYDADGELLGFRSYQGDGYLYDIILDYENRMVNVYGDAAGTNLMQGKDGEQAVHIRFPWDDLEELTVKKGTLINLWPLYHLVEDTEPLELGATVKGPDGEPVTGRVVFKNRGEVIGEADLNASGHASLEIDPLPAGHHFISAEYTGNDLYLPSLSRRSDQFVVKGKVPGKPRVNYFSRSEAPDNWPSGTTLACYNGPEYTADTTDCPVIEWDDYTFWIFQGDGDDLLLAAYDQDGIRIGTRTYSGERNIYDIVVDDAGQTAAIYGAVYGQRLEAGEDEDDAVMVRIPWSNLTAFFSGETTGTVLTTSPPDSVTEGEKLTLTAQVIVYDGGTPTGTVVFKNHGEELDEPIPLDENGFATLEIDGISAGRHGFTAEYTGGGGYNSSQSGKIVLVVDRDVSDGGPRVLYLPHDEDKHKWEKDSVLYFPYCFDGPDDYSVYADCPVIEWGDYHFRIMEDAQSESLLALAAYRKDGDEDGDGEHVGTLFDGGTRYIYEATVDAAAKTITFRGQNKGFVTFTWKELADLVSSPKATLTLSDGSVTEGQSVTLTAKVEGLLPGSIGTVELVETDGKLDPEEKVLQADGTAVFTLTDLEEGEYTFRADYSGDDYNNPAISDTVTLTVLAGQVTVEFISDGALFDSLVLQKGSKIDNPPSAPTKEGYTFAGWYKDNGTFEEAWDFANDVVTGNITLYAKWVVEKPGAPTITSITAGDASVTVSWTSVHLADGYRVYVREDGEPFGAPGTEVTELSVEITGLTNGTKYYVAVAAFNDGGEGPLSDEESATPQVPAPGAPELHAPVAGNQQVFLSWTPVASATGYDIYRSETPESYGSVAATVTGSVYQHVVTGLTNGTKYYFAVKANNPGGDSPYSNVVSAAPYTVPGAPVDAAAEAGNQTATVTFGAPADDGGSPIIRYDVEDHEGNLVAQGTSSPIQVTGLTNGQTYTFKVYAVNQAGRSAASNVTNEVIPAAPAPGDGDDDDIGDGPGDGGDGDNGDGDNGGGPGDDEGGGDNGGGNDDGGPGNDEGGEEPPADPAPADPTADDPTADDPSPADEQPEDQPVVLVEVQVGGQAIQIGAAETTDARGRRVTVITLDVPAINQLLEELQENGEQDTVISVSALAPADAVLGVLHGELVKQLEQKDAVVEITTDQAAYSLPALLVGIDGVAAQLGAEGDLLNVEVHIEISSVFEEEAQWIEDVAGSGGVTLVAPPVQFSVRAVYGDHEVELASFSTFVERKVAIPDGVDPGQITTAVVVEPGGTMRHVPTKVVNIDGRHWAVINSLTNSTYVLIWNEARFVDIAGHWAEEAILDMAARKILNGTGDRRYVADQAVTRAEFASIIVRALGLKEIGGDAFFSDVKESDWFAGAVRTAHAYNLIHGFADGTFRPHDPITREQAMVIIAHAMKLTALRDAMDMDAAERRLGAYEDAGQVSSWAKSGVALNLQAGIVSGRSGTLLAPKDHITRAEAAVMIRRLLQQAGLI